MMMTPMTIQPEGRLSSSFRDPSGFLFSRAGVLYRQINRAYTDNYEQLTSSGLYDKLVKAGLLISHTETDEPAADPEVFWKIIQPSPVAFISYPYEWSFGQLKDAALTTLSIQKRSLKYGMSLKDASAYNIQFDRGKAVLIDTLSFEKYPAGSPWVAYRQFCQHFLAPLALMAYCDVRLGQLLKIYIDGIPLDLASRLLPRRTRLNFGLATHVHVHAGAQRRFAGRSVGTGSTRMSVTGMTGLIESLEHTIKKLVWSPTGTAWGDYYENTNYSDTAFEKKKLFVRECVALLKPGKIWDLGSNTGVFSREAAAHGADVISFDADPAAVEYNYQNVKENRETNILPLFLDLTNPSPSLGWNNSERDSFTSRGPADLILALAVIHHLAVSNNLPLERLAEFFAANARWLIVEFVPKTDSQVRKLLAAREDIFPDYSRNGFEAVFSRRFILRRTATLPGNERTLYLMETQ